MGETDITHGRNRGEIEKNLRTRQGRDRHNRGETNIINIQNRGEPGITDVQNIGETDMADIGQERDEIDISSRQTKQGKGRHNTQIE